MNWKRIALGSLVGGIVLFVLEGIFGVLLTGRIYTAMLARLHLTMPSSTGAVLVDVAFSFIYAGLIAWLYAALRPRYGAGPWTALRAAVAAWIPLQIIGTGYQVDLSMMPLRDGVVIAVSALVMCGIVALVAGAMYREAEAGKAAAA
ncbi:MAG TPA: hypothetical protein VE998_05050 [Terriglobales bacterium]|nr:hypothetical protein [Terriglobales bacterium]